MEIPQRMSQTNCKEKVISLLKDLNNDKLSKRIGAVTKLGNVLCEDPQTRDYFLELEGKNAILNRLFIEEKRKFAEAALYALANSTINHIENQKALIDENIFDLLNTVMKQPNIIELQHFSHATIYLISTIVYQNSAGQHLVRESGCLNQLLHLFHKVLSNAWKIQNPIKELKNLDVVCHALYLSVNNPKNEENQKEVAVVIPKALLYLSFLIFDSKIRNDCILPCLRLFTGTLSENKATQEIFVESGGMVFLFRLIMDMSDVLEEESIETCIMLMDLIISSKNFPTSELLSTSIIKVLIDVLQKNKCKLVTLFLLFHLMENDVKMQEVFITCDGPEKMKQVCLKELENEEIDLISAGIWAMILKNNLELLKAYHCLRASEMDKDLPGDEIKRNGEEPEEKSCRMESPTSSVTSSIHTFDMTKNFDKRLPEGYKNMHKITELKNSHENTSSVSSLKENITVGINREWYVTQDPRLSSVFNIEAEIKREVESPHMSLEINERKSDESDAVQPTNFSSLELKEGIKRKLDSYYAASDIGERIRDESDAIHTTNLSPVNNITAGIKRKLELSCEDLEMVKEMNGEICVIQTSKLSPTNDIISANERKIIKPSEDLKIDIRDACIENESMPIASVNDMMDTLGRKIHYYSNRYTDEVPRCGSGVHNIPSQATSLARNINVEILKTPTGFQINLHSNRNRENFSTVKRGRTSDCESQISQVKKNCLDSDVQYAIQGKAIVASDNIIAVQNHEIDILDQNSNCMEISKPEVINLTSEDSNSDDSVVILSHERKVDETLDHKTQFNISEKTTKIKEECFSGIQTNLKTETNDRQVENGIFCPIMSLASQEINSEIGYWNESQYTVHNGVPEPCCDMEERLEDFKFQNNAEETKTNKISIDLVKESSSNLNKELMIPRGQRQRWIVQKGSLPQIPFTRQEIENLNAGIKEFGLNFVDIRKNYSFLSTRTSKDLFVAWRDGLSSEYQGNKKMISLSSDDAYSSDD